MVMIILVGILCSCACSTSKLFVVREGIAHFSFEYPATFEEPALDLTSSTVGITNVYICMPNTEVCDIFVNMTISAKNEYNPSAAQQMEDFINIYGPRRPTFTLLERASFSSGSITGERIRYTFREYKPEIATSGPFDDKEEMEAALKNMLGDTVNGISAYFDHGEFHVNITMESKADFKDQAESALEQIIRTFKFLD
jgi:hypothetical protein